MNNCGHARTALILLGTLCAGLGTLPAKAQIYYSKTEVTTYNDNTSKWVLGQVEYVVTSGVPTSRTVYDPATALPLAEYEYFSADPNDAAAIPVRQYTWTTAGAEAGTLKTLKDGKGNTTTFSSWKRGIPRIIEYPITPDQPSGAVKSAEVNDLGEVTSVTDENDFKTSYDYDPMGRLFHIYYPTSDGVNTWNTTTMTFAASPNAAYGLPAGHWRQTTTTGNSITETLYDAMWRPVVKQSYDAANASGTISQTVLRYDGTGRKSFESYPQRTLNPAITNTWANPAQAPIATGSNFEYDSLDRVLKVKQDSERGVLTTSTSYLSGFQTATTNPKLQTTTIGYQVWDEPSTSLPVWINAPEGQVTTIERNVFGRARVLRRGTSAGVLLERRNVYNKDQRVCKTIEPETGSTVMHYDAAGNLDWSAAGLSLPDISSCSDTDPSVTARKVVRNYDSRNRLTSLTFPDRNGDQSWHYTPDNLPSQITTLNVPVAGAAPKQVVNTYIYNKRRLLATESTALEGWYVFNLGYGYDNNGSLASHNYPSTETVTYQPNALGQATNIAGNTQTYASNILYHANGSVSDFNYGNGIAYSMVQNPRQLPLRVRSEGASQYEYAYDENGNPSTIFDQIDASNFHSRVLYYDNLDRLTKATSSGFGGDGDHRYTYDALDNLKSHQLTGVIDYADYVYDSANRLTNLRNSAGSSVSGLGYDVQGNLSNRDGTTYTFDFGNRLREASKAGAAERYRYDGYGRRALASRIDGPADQLGVIFSQYANNGQLMYQQNNRPAINKRIDQIYLAGSLIAQREEPFSGGGAVTVKYQHTDALGSPVAVTSGPGGPALQAIRYEPYGKVMGGNTKDGPGYAGHPLDLATGMNYMQQRYYDPTVGRFLSVDPVTANGTSGENFNRYRYASNNPYRIIDLDGRADSPAWMRAYIPGQATMDSAVESFEQGNYGMGSLQAGAALVEGFAAVATMGASAELTMARGIAVTAKTEVAAVSQVSPKSLLGRQGRDEMSGSLIKRLAKDMKANGFNASKPIDIANVEGKKVIIDGHHRAAAAIKAGVEKVPVVTVPTTKQEGTQLLKEVAETRLMRDY